ncbi:MAG: ATP-binding protein [Oscillospiraceae bacterium]|nr:ATP-binding protein [Oscillospiraceae bacterium]
MNGNLEKSENQKKREIKERGKNLKLPLRKSISFRLMVILAGLSLFIVIIAMVFLSVIYQARIESEYTGKAVLLSKIAASMTDGESVDRYLLTLEKDDGYYETLERLQVQLRESGVTYIYISAITGREEIIVFDAEEEDEEVDLGFVISLEDEQYDEAVLTYERGEAFEPYIFDTEWGRLFTASEFIYRSDGSVAALANVAVAIDKILAERMFVFVLLGVIILITSMAFAAAGFYAARKLVIQPVRILADGVSAYVPGENLPDLFSGDNLKSRTYTGGEIEILRRSLTDMAERTEKMFGEVSQLEAARLANNAKSEFLARMSHEIRTPMNTIVGISQMRLQMNGMPEELAKDWVCVYDAGNNLLAIINDILDMSKIETGKMELNISDYSLPSMINDAVTLNIIRIGSKPIEMILDIDENLPLNLIGDELRLKQILSNLLSNAIKYTEKGSVKLSVSHFMRDNDLMLRFAVKDTGRGIKPEDMKNLFTEFMRFNVSANLNIEGTGLGLNIAKNLAVMMGGDIKAESEYGSGSEFTVTVMQERVNGEIIGKELADRIRGFKFSEDKRFKNMQIIHSHMPYGKVLIVDDVRSNLFVASGLMKPYGLQIEPASSGFEVLDKIRAGNIYDIIFMDHMMPGMDGIETTLKLRESGYKGAVVALTANAIVGNDVMFRQNGFDDFISKPIDMRYLDAVLNKYIRDKYPEEAAKYKLKVKDRQSGETQKLLKLFLDDAREAVVNLRKAISRGDMKLLAFTAHAMKGALNNIGSGELSRRAAELENAGRTGDSEFLFANCESFTASLESLVNTLESVGAKSKSDIDSGFGPGSDTDTDTRTTGGMAETTEIIEEDEAYLSEQLLIIKKACADYDDAAAYAALARLKNKPWKKETADVLEEIYDILFIDSNFESAEEKISVRFPQTLFRTE